MPKEVTPAEAAKLTGYTLSYIYYLLRAGQLQGKQTLGRWEIPVDALKKLPRLAEAKEK
jgi:excisionase family DNA binding protein